MPDLVDGERLRCRIINMRKLLLISVSALLLVTIGCVTAFKMEIQSSHPIEEWNNTFWINTIVENYGNLEGGLGGSADIFKAEAINLETGEKFHAGGFPNEYTAVFNTLKGCSKHFNSICVISKTNDSIIYANVDDYRESRKRSEEIARNYQKREKEKEKQKQRPIKVEQEQRQEKERIVAELRERCASYGFSGDENIAACIQREAQHDLELAQQRRELQLAQQRLANQNRQPQVVEEEVPWILQFLGDVAMGVAEGYAHDAIYHKDKPKVIYRNCDVYKC